MMTVYSCVVLDHDLRLVLLAAIVCTAAAFAALRLVQHAMGARGRMRALWLGIAATSSGFGIWATHFIAMLAFSPSMEAGYDIGLTVLSLGAAVLLTAAGLGLALTLRFPLGRALGGAVVAGGIAAMHYTGMDAYRVAGTIEWRADLVIASIVIGAVLGMAALAVGLGDRSRRSLALGTALLVLAICGHHFTAMAAAALRPDPTVVIEASSIPASILALFVSASALVILLLACAALALDIRDSRHRDREAERMRGLADAAVEGLLICDGDTIMTVNHALAAMAQVAPDDATALRLSQILPDTEARGLLLADTHGRIETYLLRRDAERLPVEVIQRPVSFAGRPCRAVAVRDLSDSKKAESEIHFLAHHDTLTGLANRATFDRKLDEAIAGLVPGAGQVAVLCLDLDRFKEVNDLFGHATGDALLKAVASSISAVLAPGQILARLGGDEFAILLPSVAAPAQAGRLAEVVLETVRREQGVTGISARASLSIGIALYPQDAADRTSLLSHADTALYRAKLEGRGTYRFYESAMGAQIRDRRLLEHDLSNAIARRELSLVYQPQARVDGQDVIGFEALIRWRHHERGTVSPSLFIPLAEECGLILQIGEWVLRNACREAATWQKPLAVAVNISTVQLHSPNFPHLVHEILLQTGLTPGRLELEITETALIKDLGRALKTLRQLKALGVRVAMDDFGTGYSSLSNLRSFPFDKIKIDGSFIQSVDTNAQAATIVRAVLGLGRGLGLPVLAEGVETLGELSFLGKEDCTEVQGYLLGRPQAIEAFRHLTHQDGEQQAPAGNAQGSRVA